MGTQATAIRVLREGTRVNFRSSPHWYTGRVMRYDVRDTHEETLYDVRVEPEQGSLSGQVVTRKGLALYPVTPDAGNWVAVVAAPPAPQEPWYATERKARAAEEADKDRAAIERAQAGALAVGIEALATTIRVHRETESREHAVALALANVLLRMEATALDADKVLAHLRRMR